MTQIHEVPRIEVQTLQVRHEDALRRADEAYEMCTAALEAEKQQYDTLNRVDAAAVSPDAN
ncbi:MAG: hypothetical protein ACRDQ2_05735 [Gaiellales bacterium]